MATVNALSTTDGNSPGGANLCTAQTGVTFFSTNIADFGAKADANGVLKLVSAIGATPTATVNIEGSLDGVNWYNIQYSLAATPDTWTLAALVITTAVTSYYALRRLGGLPWRYVRLNVSADTNVTLTGDVTSFG